MADTAPYGRLKMSWDMEAAARAVHLIDWSVSGFLFGGVWGCILKALRSNSPLVVPAAKRHGFKRAERSFPSARTGLGRGIDELRAGEGERRVIFQALTALHRAAW